jgi:hypothetical protein
MRTLTFRPWQSVFVHHPQRGLLEPWAGERGTDGVLVKDGAEPRGAAAPAEARESVLDGGEVEQSLDLGLVARALQLPARYDRGEVQQRQRHGGAWDAVDHGAIRRLEAAADVRPDAVDVASTRRHGDLYVREAGSAYPPQGRAGAMAQQRPWPARQHGGHAHRVGAHRPVPDGVDARKSSQRTRGL